MRENLVSLLGNCGIGSWSVTSALQAAVDQVLFWRLENAEDLLAVKVENLRSWCVYARGISQPRRERTKGRKMHIGSPLADSSCGLGDAGVSLILPFQNPIKLSTASRPFSALTTAPLKQSMSGLLVHRAGESRTQDPNISRPHGSGWCRVDQKRLQCNLPNKLRFGRGIPIFMASIHVKGLDE